MTITINYYGDYVKAKHNAGELVGMTGAQAKAWASKNKINVSGITSDTAKVKSVSNSGEVEEGGSVSVTMEEEKKPEKPEEQHQQNQQAQPTQPTQPEQPKQPEQSGKN